MYAFHLFIFHIIERVNRCFLIWFRIINIRYGWNCANEWNLILFDRYTPVNDKIGYGENRESDYLCILTIYNFLLRTMRRYANLLAVLALSTNLALHAQTNELVIQTKKLGAEIQPTMYGLFFEDINYAADGGLMPNW